MSLTVVKEQDAGEYEVRATNILGSVESKSIVTVISEYSVLRLFFYNSNFDFGSRLFDLWYTYCKTPKIYKRWQVSRKF